MKLEREASTMHVRIEPGMVHGQVCVSPYPSLFHQSKLGANVQFVPTIGDSIF